MAKPDTEIGGNRRDFPNTVWGVILTAIDKNSKDYRDKMALLIQMYWRPVYRYIRVNWKKSNEEAKDMTQEFFSRVLEKNNLRNASPEKGRFRSYLLVSLKHFMLNEKKKNMAKMRSAVPTIRFDETANDTLAGSDHKSPDELFDREWSRTVISRALATLRKRLTEQGKEIYYKVFASYELSSKDLSYKEVAHQLGIKDTDVRNYLVQTRLFLRNIIKEEVSQYVLDYSEIDDELRYILSMARL